MIFFIVTGGRVPSYLGCSGSIFSVVLSVTGYQYTENNPGLNSNIAPAQGAILILSLCYILVAVLVMVFGYQWLEYFMPPGILIQLSLQTHYLNLFYLSGDRCYYHEHWIASVIYGLQSSNYFKLQYLYGCCDGWSYYTDICLCPNKYDEKDVSICIDICIECNTNQCRV
jgi:hypothetical protein